jgi:hypothetical protein
VSHVPQRKEKDCLNCGAIVQGPYCQHCGQENIVPHETFWHMAKHFFYDITHFDSKFFDTLKDLLLRPGFLSKEYVKGRRASYLNPIKMYVFTSAVFFLLFFSLVKPEESLKINIEEPLTPKQREQTIAGLEEAIKHDTAQFLKDQVKLLKDTAKEVTGEDLIKSEGKKDGSFFNITGTARDYKSTKEYDSVQRTLPAGKKDGWMLRTLKKKEINLNQKYGSDPATGLKKLFNGFLHKLPYLLFVSLPLFALFLKLLYVRRNEFYYFDHGIFSIHHYIFTFILLFVVFMLRKLSDWMGLGIFDIAAVILFLSGGFYLYKSMRKFYGQRRAKTVIKFLLLNLMGFIGMILLFSIFVLFSVFEL